MRVLGWAFEEESGKAGGNGSGQAAEPLVVQVCSMPPLCGSLVAGHLFGVCMLALCRWPAQARKLPVCIRAAGHMQPWFLAAWPIATPH